MKTKPLFLFGCLTLVSFIFVGQTRATDTTAEQALRDLDAQWSAAAGAKDFDKTVSYYAESAIVMPPNSPTVTTSEGIRKIWQDMLASPSLVASWTATQVEVAQSGDIGYTSGNYELTLNDASGKPLSDHGKYVEVWKKQTDGTWKCVLDIWNSDLPVMPSEKK